MGAPLLRRAGVLCLCLLQLALGCGRRSAEAVLGCFGSSFLFVCPLFGVLDQFYGLVGRRPPRQRVPLLASAADGVFAAGLLQLVAIAQLGRSLVSGVGASDASPFASGAGWTGCPFTVAACLFSCTEVREGLPLPQEFEDRPDEIDEAERLATHWVEAALFLAGALWDVVFYVFFQVSRRMNVLELLSLIMFDKQLVGRRHCNGRGLIGLYSRVVLGAAEKRRGSSTTLNFHIRRLAGLCGIYKLMLILFGLPTCCDPAEARSRLGPLTQWKKHFPAIAVNWDSPRHASTEGAHDLPAGRRHRVPRAGVRIALGSALLRSYSALPRLAALRRGVFAHLHRLGQMTSRGAASGLTSFAINAYKVSLSCALDSCCGRRTSYQCSRLWFGGCIWPVLSWASRSTSWRRQQRCCRRSRIGRSLLVPPVLEKAAYLFLLIKQKEALQSARYPHAAVAWGGPGS